MALFYVGSSLTHNGSSIILELPVTISNYADVACINKSLWMSDHIEISEQKIGGAYLAYKASHNTYYYVNANYI